MACVAIFHGKAGHLLSQSSSLWNQLLYNSFFWEKQAREIVHQKCFYLSTAEEQ